VLNLSEWKILTKILLPSALPYMLTGVRLSIGTAWLVIVAAEMLTGGVGIGFWVGRVEQPERPAHHHRHRASAWLVCCWSRRWWRWPVPSPTNKCPTKERRSWKISSSISKAWRWCSTPRRCIPRAA
jgi:hypothetical protein